MSLITKPRQSVQFIRYCSLIVLVLSFTGGVVRERSGSADAAPPDPNSVALPTARNAAGVTVSLVPIGNDPFGTTDPGVVILGNEITMESGGRPLFLEFRIGNWDPANAGVELAAWQLKLDASSLASGAHGKLTAYTPGGTGTCPNGDADCAVLLGPGASCDPPGYYKTAQFGPGYCSYLMVDEARPDYVYHANFGTSGGIQVIDVSHVNVRPAGTVIIRGPSAPQPFPVGGLYAGTLSLWISSEATGVFTISLLSDQEDTQLIDQDSQFIGPLKVIPVVLIIPDCDGDGISDADEINGCDPEQEPGCADCNEDGIPDGCNIEDCGECLPLDGENCSPEVLACQDCNGNGRPDGCDQEDCQGTPDCDNCNGGHLDECDITSGRSLDGDGDGVPDECAEPEIDCEIWTGPDCWSGFDQCDPDFPFPNNTGQGCPGRWVTISGSSPPSRTATAGVSGMLLDVTVEVEGLRLINGGTLLVTKQGDDGDLSTAVVGIINQGNLLVCNDRQIKLAEGNGTMLIGSGGFYGRATGPNASACAIQEVSASLAADNIIITEGDCDSILPRGGELNLDEAMTVTLAGDLVLAGADASGCTAGGVASRLGITPSPKFRITGPGSATVLGDFQLDGFAETLNSGQVGLASAGRAEASGPFIGGMKLGGDFVNHAIAPRLFDWVTGRLIMNGDEPQVFEVAGIDFARSVEGFLTDRETLFDSGLHKNYSIGKFEVAVNSDVTFVNEFANTVGAGPCEEALYVRRMTLGAGSMLTLDNVRVYYEELEGDPSGVQASGCGALINLCDADAPTTSVAIRNRYLSFSAGTSGQVQAIRVNFVELPSPFDTWNGSKLWVGPVSEVSQSGASVPPIPGFDNFNAAMLQCTPHYDDWTQYGVIHAFHEGVVPAGSYTIQAVNEVCDAGSEANFSAPLELSTALWGDTVKDCATTPCPPPNGSVDIIDCFAVIQRFVGADGAIVKSRADLEPNCVDLLMNILDVLQCINSINGLPYAFDLTAKDQCESTCPNPLP